MDKASYDEWLESPVTEYFRKYLEDSALEEARFVADAILSGETIPVEDQIRVSTMSMMFKQIAIIDFEEIDGFYKSK